MRIVIGGDVCPTPLDMEFFKAGDAKSLFGDLLQHFETADLSIINLECPLIQKPSPFEKSGPVLGTPSQAINAIKNAAIDLVNLANNHILDHGTTGLFNTTKVLDSAGLEYVGVGANARDAMKFWTRDINGIKIGVCALAQHEWSCATEVSPGAAPLDMMNYVRAVREFGKNTDFLIVLFHGGVEYYQYPSPALVDTCHFLVEEGADIIVCQHSHCVSCYERYNDKAIVYGQGNLLFGPLSKGVPVVWFNGLLIKIDFLQDLSYEIEFTPFEQSQRGPGVRILSKGEESIFMNDFKARSKTITDPAAVQRLWDKFCDEKRTEYESMIAGYNKWGMRLNKRFGIFRLFRSRAQIRLLRNIIRCEAHREILDKILKP